MHPCLVPKWQDLTAAQQTAKTTITQKIIEKYLFTPSSCPVSIWQ